MDRISLLTRSRSDLASRVPRSDGLDDAFGRRHADVRRDQRLLERLDRLDVYRPAPAVGIVGARDDLVEPLQKLLRGARQRLFDLVEDTHGQI